MTPALVITNLITVLKILGLATLNVVVAGIMVNYLVAFIILAYKKIRDVNKEDDEI